MATKEQIEDLFKKSMVEKDEVSLSVARLLKSAIKNAEIDFKHELSEEEVIGVLEKQAKQRRDSIDQFEKAERADLAEKEKVELEIIEKFLPEKMSEEEVREIVKKKVTEMEGQDFGRVMGAVMSELKGKADGGTVQKIVREEMGQ